MGSGLTHARKPQFLLPEQKCIGLGSVPPGLSSPRSVQFGYSLMEPGRSLVAEMTPIVIRSRFWVRIVLFYLGKCQETRNRRGNKRLIHYLRESIFGKKGALFEGKDHFLMEGVTLRPDIQIPVQIQLIFFIFSAIIMFFYLSQRAFQVVQENPNFQCVKAPFFSFLRKFDENDPRRLRSRSQYAVKFFLGPIRGGVLTSICMGFWCPNPS